MGWHGLGERELNIALLTERNALYKQDVQGKHREGRKIEEKKDNTITKKFF